MKQSNKSILGTALGIAIGAAVLFGTAWVISKGWKSGQA